MIVCPNRLVAALVAGLTAAVTAAPPEDASAAARYVTLSLDDLSAPDAGDDPAAGLGRGPDEGLGENLRLGLDVGTRLRVSDTGAISTLSFAGIDVLKVLSAADGDWGVIKTQVYLARIDNDEKAPRHFEDEDDWEALYNDVYFDFRGLAGGHLTVRVGHFDLPFGLEPTFDTNLTLRQFMNESDLGLKNDWGVGVHGDLPALEYEVSVSRGSGNEWSARGDPWVFAGRIGTPREENFVVGVSGFAGDVQVTESRRDTKERWRIGADSQYHIGQSSLLGEVSFGEDMECQIFNMLAGWDWHDTSSQWYLYVQGRYGENEYYGNPQQYASVYVGVKYLPDAQWVFSAQYKHYVDTFRTYPREGAFTFQIRRRF